MGYCTDSLAVVIPVYNGSRYLAETLESVLSQTVQPSEILLIDDGSTDNSAELAQSIDPRIRIIRRVNQGISASRNLGADLASAEWITFLDQDDVLEPDAFARRAAALIADPDCDVCYTGRRHLCQIGTSSSFTLTAPIWVPPVKKLRTLLNDRCFFNPGSATIRRSALLAVGGFDRTLDGVEDWDLWIRLLDHGCRFTRLPQPLFRYRVHGSSATQNAPRILERSLSLLQKTILPRLSPWQRVTLAARVVSRLEAEAAIAMRSQKLPHFRKMMLRSLLHHPFHFARRYTIAAHMALNPTASKAQEVLPFPSGGRPAIR